MSAGHKLNNKYGPDFVKANLSIYTDGLILQEMAKPYLVFRNYDIPYLAGYSVSGGHFYIDRHLPRYLRAGRKTFETRLVLNHERMEAAIIHKYNWEYAAAHAMAEHYEDNIYRELGYDPTLVEAAYKPYIKEAASEKIKIAPKDLDLSPYTDSNDRKDLAKLKRAM